MPKTKNSKFYPIFNKKLGGLCVKVLKRYSKIIILKIKNIINFQNILIL